MGFVKVPRGQAGEAESHPQPPPPGDNPHWGPWLLHGPALRMALSLQHHPALAPGPISTHTHGLPPLQGHPHCCRPSPPPMMLAHTLLPSPTLHALREPEPWLILGRPTLAGHEWDSGGVGSRTRVHCSQGRWLDQSSEVLRTHLDFLPKGRFLIQRARGGTSSDSCSLLGDVGLGTTPRGMGAGVREKLRKPRWRGRATEGVAWAGADWGWETRQGQRSAPS